MKVSQLYEIQSSRDMVDAFLGYNHNLRIGDAEFFEMLNMTSDYYPVLSPRHKRGIYSFPVTDPPIAHDPVCLAEKDALCYVDNGTLYINSYPVDNFSLSDDIPKYIVPMGAYLIIMPDKKYINTLDYTDKGDIDALWTNEIEGSSLTQTVSFKMCRSDGRLYDSDEIIVSGTEPENPTNNMLWMDTSTDPHSLKQYSSVSGMWVSIATTYVRIECPNIAADFKQYDGVTISGIKPSITQLQDLNDKTSVIWDIYHDEGHESSGQGDPSRAEGTNDYIVMIGILDYASSQEEVMTIKRQMPQMDFMIESENRLWGCRYGTANNGEVVNEIYASKLGDFKNWNCFMGISTDSYAASCGTDGQWTGAITHLGHPCFFKENFLHKVYGNFPSNFQIQTTALRGVQKGAGKSLAIVNEILYYKARNGVCAYDGSLPTEVSGAFGDLHYSAVDETMTDTLRNGAVAGALHNKYYISMKSEEDGKWYMFAYDTKLGAWHKEDEIRARDFSTCRNDLYFIDADAKQIKSVLGLSESTEESGELPWSVESGVIGITSPDKKYVSRILMRMSLGIGSLVHIDAQYDSVGDWEHLATVNGTTLKTFTIPVKPKRCDHLRLRIYGRGEFKLYSLTKTVEQGSDI